jgi:spore germination protein KB
MVLHRAKEPHKAARAGALGALCSGLFTAICAAGLLMFYGGPETRRLVYPLYDLTRSITVGDFFERLDALFIFLWSAGSFVKIAYLQWAVATRLEQILGLKRGRHLLLPLGLLLAVAAPRTYDTQSEVYLLNAPSVYLLLTAPFLLILPLLTAGSGFVRRWGARRS